MSDRVHHCPFLNRSDRRCSEHFSLEHLREAFTYCFGTYKTCPAYAELLVERKLRRGEPAGAGGDGADATHPFVQVTFGATSAHAANARREAPAHGYAKHAAGVAGLSAAPRF